MSDNYKKVDVLKYVKEGLESGSLVPFEAEKFARPIIVQGVVGQEVITWSVDKEGKPIIEKRDVVKIDEKTGRPGWIVTKTGEDGMPVRDEHGHLNQWINSDSEYQKRYVPAPELGEGVHKPTGGPQIFVQLHEDLIIFQWGKEMKVSAGGYANITNPSDVYAISGRDFDDIYRRTSTDVKTYKIQ